jgi:hypothetical protein
MEVFNDWLERKVDYVACQIKLPQMLTDVLISRPRVSSYCALSADDLNYNFVPRS